MRKRIVLGLRETLKFAAVGRIKAVVVAPDLEDIRSAGIMSSLMPRVSLCQPSVLARQATIFLIAFSFPFASARW